MSRDLAEELMAEYPKTSGASPPCTPVCLAPQYFAPEILSFPDKLCFPDKLFPRCQLRCGCGEKLMRPLLCACLPSSLGMLGLGLVGACHAQLRCGELRRVAEPAAPGRVPEPSSLKPDTNAMIKWNFGARTASEWIGQDSISDVKFNGKVSHRHKAWIQPPRTSPAPSVALCRRQLSSSASACANADQTERVFFRSGGCVRTSPRIPTTAPTSARALVRTQTKLGAFSQVWCMRGAPAPKIKCIVVIPGHWFAFQCAAVSCVCGGAASSLTITSTAEWEGGVCCR